MSDSPQVNIDLELLHKLGPLAESMGILLPGMTRFAATIDVARPIRELALEIGMLVAQKDIYLKNGSVVTVNPDTGEIKAMTSTRFVGWVEEFCAFKSSGRTQRARDSLSREDCTIILDQDIFKECLRPLTAVHTVVLPVRRGATAECPQGRVEFLEPGWDAESGIYTAALLKYDMDWEFEQGREWLMEVCSEVPWNGMEEAETRDLSKNRSFSVHVLAMLGTYCRSVFPIGTLRPMIAYFANKPGTGKTRMAEMALAAVYGFVAGTGAPKDEEKMDVKLETIARAMRSWVVFDDIGGSLRSHALNRFVTETTHSGRCYNSNSEFFEVPNVTQIFVTANELAVTEDLGRRALIAELFLAEEVRGRKFKRVITPHWLASDETRRKFLSALCAMVKHWLKDWEENGVPFLHTSPLETFDDFTSVMGGMVYCAGFADPLAKPEMDVGGAGQEDEIKKLLIEAASLSKEDRVENPITREELVELARSKGLLEDLVGLPGAGGLDDTMNKRFGKRMQRWRGQHLRDNLGRKFQFGHKRRKTGATYPLTFIKG